MSSQLPSGSSHWVFGGSWLASWRAQRCSLVYYESRMSKLSLNAAALPKLDAEFEEITEGEV